MALDARLRAILVCPVDHGELLDVVYDDAAALYNPRLRRLYRIDEDIPVLLVDEAVDISAAEHDTLVGIAQ